MKTHFPQDQPHATFRAEMSHRPHAFTLLEMTVVICVLMTLIGIGLFVSSKMTNWKRGRQASEVLRGVYAAQRMYLSDNPTVTVSSITTAQLIPYLPDGTVKIMGDGTKTMPTVTSLTGAVLAIKIDVSPPVVNSGSNTAYDPSGSTSDNLWDVGE